MSNILIIGESCLDIFVYCDAKRLCPDVPVPVLNIVDTVVSGGMAKNVERNILTHCQCNLLTNSNWMNISKTRYVDNKTNHYFFRVDSEENVGKVDLENCLNIVENFECVVISDYDKGYLSEDDIQKIAQKSKISFLDTKKILGDWALDCTYIKINDHEYNNSRNYIESSPIANRIIHTDGANGSNFRGENFSVPYRVEVKDSSGAGDSFLAALVVCFIKTKNIKESIMFANSQACQVVQHRGVTTIM